MNPLHGAKQHPSSFRDPSGFLFVKDGLLHRQINATYKSHYDRLMNSGLYDALVRENRLIPHHEAATLALEPETAYKVITPETVPFISYPYEWCFSQLQDAALATLEIQKIALAFDMTLKDASAYNIQFNNGKPILVDTLSFEIYAEGQCWRAYRQFCQHFLAPLALASYADIRLNHLLLCYLDGIPLDLASRLLPARTRLRFPLLSHIHAHAYFQKRYEQTTFQGQRGTLSRLGLRALIDNLEQIVANLRWRHPGKGWSRYYQDTHYSDVAMQSKRKIVAELLDRLCPKFVFDCGANTGIFSRIAARVKAQAVSFDSDEAAVEENYRACKEENETRILPLVVDMTNPSSGIGWENTERPPFFERGPIDTALALALVHHLVIAHNIPLPRIAHFFARICNNLIIEFIPQDDAQAQRMIANRNDIFHGYTQANFEKLFGEYFMIESSAGIADSERTLYWLRKK